MKLLPWYCFAIGLCTIPLRAKYQRIVKAPVEQIPVQPYIPPYKTAKSSYPYITGYTFRSLCDFIVDSVTNNLVPERVEAGDIIFVSRDFIEEFFTTYRPHIKNPYILLTHHYEGNCTPPTPGPYAPYAEDEKLIAWFTLNADIQHPKVRPLPLGIANSFYPTGDTQVYDLHIKKHRHTPKDNLLYSNFAPNTDERLAVYNHFLNKDFCTQASRKELGEYLEEMAHYKFVLSPPGAGTDCFRTWEALLMGSIPIVRSSNIDQLFKGLPVLIVHNWNEITEEFLEQKYEELKKNTDYNYAKLYMPYWVNNLQTCKYNAKLSLEGV